MGPRADTSNVVSGRNIRSGEENRTPEGSTLRRLLAFRHPSRSIRLGVNRFPSSLPAFQPAGRAGRAAHLAGNRWSEFTLRGADECALGAKVGYGPWEAAPGETRWEPAEWPCAGVGCRWSPVQGVAGQSWDMDGRSKFSRIRRQRAQSGAPQSHRHVRTSTKASIPRTFAPSCLLVVRLYRFPIAHPDFAPERRFRAAVPADRAPETRHNRLRSSDGDRSEFQEPMATFSRGSLIARASPGRRGPARNVS